MKNILVIVLTAISVNAFCQSDTYLYPPASGSSAPADGVHLFNADSILRLNHFQTSWHVYEKMNAEIANSEMEVLGELHGEYFVKELDHTYVRDINILLPGEDTVILKQRAFIYKDTAEAGKVFHHLSEKIVSAISVPNYRIIYREGRAIFFISVKSYLKDQKDMLPSMIYPIYNALAPDKKNTYVMYKHDLRIQKSR